MSRSSPESAADTSDTARPAASRPARATDAVNVVLGHERQVVVDDQRQLRDVEAARRDVGGHQHVDAAGLEVAERPRSRALALVAVNDRRLDAGALEVFADAIRAALGLAEDERLTRAPSCVSTCVSSVALSIDGDRMHMVRHGRRDDLPSETSTRAASRVNSAASLTTSSGSVAENSSV